MRKMVFIVTALVAMVVTETQSIAIGVVMNAKTIMVIKFY